MPVLAVCLARHAMMKPSRVTGHQACANPPYYLLHATHTHTTPPWPVAAATATVPSGGCCARHARCTGPSPACALSMCLDIVCWYPAVIKPMHWPFASTPFPAPALLAAVRHVPQAQLRATPPTAPQSSWPGPSPLLSAWSRLLFCWLRFGLRAFLLINAAVETNSALRAEPSSSLSSSRRR